MIDRIEYAAYSLRRQLSSCHPPAERSQSGRKDSHHWFECPSTKILVTNEAKESCQAKVGQNTVNEQM